MPNLAKIIAANNNKVLSEDKRFEQQLPGNSNCNCRGGNESCPMEGAMCKDTNLLYQATVVEPNPVTRVSDIMGWRLDLINKLTPPACAAQHVYYCGNRNALNHYNMVTAIKGCLRHN